MSDEVFEERRYGEVQVVLTHGLERLYGTRFCRYPVDEPPVVHVPSISKTLYLSAWKRFGWQVTERVTEATRGDR